MRRLSTWLMALVVLSIVSPAGEAGQKGIGEADGRGFAAGRDVEQDRSFRSGADITGVGPERQAG